MRICHVITRLIVGGAQENTLLTCAGLHERGHEVALLTGPETGPEGSLLEEARAGGYTVEIIDELRRAVNPWRDWQARRVMAAWMQRWHPEVVHTHSSKAGILARLAAHDAGVPVIVHTIHGMSFNRTQFAPARWLYRTLERHCARFTDKIVTVADAMRDQAVMAGIAEAEKFVTVYSGMRTEWFSPRRGDRRAVRREWGFEDNAVVVGTIARLFHNKGYETLIPAMADAAQQSPNLRFVWIGDGDQRAEYERQLVSLGIRQRVLLTGLVSPQEVARLLAGMDMLVHASQWEGLPRAAVQALLMGKPVVSFDIDGAPEVVIPEQTGILAPLNDVTGLADGILTLAWDPGLRGQMGHEGRLLCMERFDHRRMVDALDELYRTLADPVKD